MKASIKSSTFARTLEIAKLAARVSLKELGSKDFKSRIEQATMIASSLSNLKGAAMKAGQLLSLDLDGYFPPEAIEILSQLQNAATAHPYSEIEHIINKEIPPTKRAAIANISKFPIGVASIGQVHLAQLQDRSIVLKVQYPGVDSSVDADLKILKTLALSFCQLTGKKMNLDPLFNEFKFILEQELDYSAEAKFQISYKEKIEHLNKLKNYNFRVPLVIEDFSTGKVLTMTFEKGVGLRAWINSKPPKWKRELLGKALLDLYFYEFFEWGLVQTDPNWGNFLVAEENGVPTLCLLDFGATRRYSKSFVKDYMRLLTLVSENKSEDIKDLAIKCGFIDARESNQAFVAFEEMLREAIRPFFIQNNGEKVFNFADPQNTFQSQEAAKKLSNTLVFSPPPYALIFLHRKLAGIYSILKGMELEIDLSPYWQMMLILSSTKD